MKKVFGVFCKENFAIAQRLTSWKRWRNNGCFFDHAENVKTLAIQDSHPRQQLQLRILSLQYIPLSVGGHLCAKVVHLQQ